MKKISKFIGGFFVGLSITALLIIVFLVDPMKKKAIEKSFAEIKLKTPYDAESVFNWKEII